MLLKWNPFDNEGDRLLRKYLLTCTTSEQARNSHGSLGTKRGVMAWSRMKPLLYLEVIPMSYEQTQSHLDLLLGKCPTHHMYQSLIDGVLAKKAREEHLSRLIQEAQSLDALRKLHHRYFHVSIRGWKKEFEEREHIIRFLKG
jgi:hypothetical protein